MTVTDIEMHITEKPKRVLRFAAIVFGCGLAAAVLPATASTEFDGVYNVEVTTDVGNCAKTYHGTVTIQDGHMVSTSEPGVTNFGLVESDGTVSIQLQLNDDVAHVAGTVKGRKGQGTWSAPTPECGGHWRAERQG